MTRAVDSAMAAGRRAKDVVRRKWIEEVRRLSEGANGDCPLYLTLPGAAGDEVQLLVDEGILETTAVGSIAEECQWKVVAIESSPPAVFALKQRFPGLLVREETVENLLRGGGPFSWPPEKDRVHCRAAVVNLDLNTALIGDAGQGLASLPVFPLIAKLAELHAIPPHLEWVLCLTLHGEAPWGEPLTSELCAFLKENFARSTEFKEQCRGVLGEEVFGLVLGATQWSLGQRSREDQQRALMAFVPKRIARDLHHRGWRLEEEANWMYGGTNEAAPMVTWVLRLIHDRRAIPTPDAVYRDSIKTILTRAGRIATDGTVSAA